MAIPVASRFLAPILATVLALAAFAPGKAHASDELVRVLVNVADVIYHGGQPYYRHGNYGRHDRVVIVRDHYHRPTYYRYAPRHHTVVYRPAPPPYGYAHGFHRPAPPAYYVAIPGQRIHDRDHRRHDRRDDGWRDDRRRHGNDRYSHDDRRGHQYRGR